MPAHIQQLEFRNNNNIRIILSEECYKKLLYYIHLCGVHTGKENFEYGTILYGNIKGKNGESKIYFDVPSKINDYVFESMKLNVYTGAMVDELIENIIDDDASYDCIAHIHTHPYIDETSRFLSDEDLTDYRGNYTSINNIAKMKEKKIYTLAGLLTVSPDHLDDKADISFVIYEPDSDEFNHIPQISVMIGENEVSLDHISDSYTFPDKDVVNFERTLIKKRR